MTTDPSKYGLAYLLTVLLNQFSIIGQVSIFFAIVVLFLSLFFPTTRNIYLGFSLLFLAFSNHYWMMSGTVVILDGEVPSRFQRIAKISTLLAGFFLLLAIICAYLLLHPEDAPEFLHQYFPDKGAREAKQTLLTIASVHWTQLLHKTIFVYL